MNWKAISFSIVVTFFIASCTKKGEPHFSPSYSHLYKIIESGVWGYIDSTGRIQKMFANSYNSNTDGTEFHNGVALLKNEHNVALVNLAFDTLFSDSSITDYENIPDYPDYYVLHYDNTFHGYDSLIKIINCKGKVLAQFDSACGLVSGRCGISFTKKATITIIIDLDETKPDQNKKAKCFIVHRNRYRYFSENMISYCEDNTCGYYNSDRRLVIPFQFKSADNFKNGIARVQTKTGLFGFIDKQGNFVIEPKYKNVNDFSEGRAAAQSVSGKWGFIKKIGQWVVEPKLDSVCDFKEGLCPVQSEGKWFVIDTSGTRITELPDADSYSSFSQGFTVYKSEGKFGYCDRFGKRLTEAIYVEAEPFDHGLAHVYKNTDLKWNAYINREGEIVWEYPKTK